MVVSENADLIDTETGILLTNKNKSHWMELVMNNLENSTQGSEFICIYNRDSNVFMSNNEFQYFILNRTNSEEPLQLDHPGKKRT